MNEVKERDMLDLTPGSAVAVDPPANLPSVAQETGRILSMIEQAALNPAIDVAKMGQLLDMQERILKRNAMMAFNTALIEMKPLLPVIDRKGKIEIRDKNNRSEIIQSTPFARWEDIDEAITPILHEHGFVLHFHTDSAADGRVIVTAVLKHRDGHEERSSLPPMPLDTSGSKNNVQGVGSTLSYGKRYAATLLLNIRTKGEDDDGKAGGAKTITEQQAADLRALMDEVKANKDRFLEFFGVASLEELPVNRYSEAVQMLNAKRNPPPKRKAQEGRQ